MAKRSAVAEVVKVLGHQEGCRRCLWPGHEWECPDNPEFHCTCTYPDEILLAAAQGTLRREHQWVSTQHGEGRRCENCGLWHDFYKPAPFGPCYPQPDGAMAWEMVLAIVRCTGRDASVWRWLVDALMHLEPLGAIARLWLRLWEGGLVE